MSPRTEHEPGTSTLERIVQSKARLVGLFAPPGYGKWRLAQQFAGRFERIASSDALEDKEAEFIIASLARSLGLPLENWHELEEPWCIAIDHAEVLEEAELARLLQRLLSAAPTHVSFVVCSAREPAFSFVELLSPEATLTLRAPDLAIPLHALRNRIPPQSAVGDMTLYWIYQISGGWPLVCEYLLQAATQGRFDRDLGNLQQHAWTDLFDWLEAKVLRWLDPACIAALIEATTRMDARTNDFDNTQRDAVMRLVREHQLAKIGVAGELRVAAFVRLYLLVRRLPEMRERALRIAADDDESPVRKVRALVNVGELAPAEHMLAGMTEAEHLSSGDYSYPGVLLERLHPNKPPFHSFPHCWVAFAGARSFAETPLTLAEEGIAMLARVELEDDRQLRAWTLLFTALFYARSGQTPIALAHLNQFDPQNDREASLQDAGHIVIDAMGGRYARVFERWARSSRWIVSHPTLYATLLRFVIRSTIAIGALDRAKEQVRLMASLTNVGGSPLLCAAAAAEATLLACVAADTGEFERRRAELLRILLDCEAPALWRFSAATFGLEVTGTAPSDPYLEAAAPLMRTIHGHGEDMTSLALVAVRVADASSYAWLRCASRVVASAIDTAHAPQLLDEALAIARELDAPAIAQSVEQLISGEHDGGLFTSILARIRSNRLEAERRRERVPIGGLFFDIGSGCVARDGEPVEISDGSLALITLIAVRRGNVKRDVILDTLWPNVDAISANSALKMCVHRARLQLGSAHAILVSRGLYSFGTVLRSDLESVMEYASRTTAMPLPDANRAEMRQLFSRLQTGGHGAWAPWGWFLPYAKLLADAYQSIGEMLVRDSLERGEYHQALSTAREMVNAQPLDEAPRVLVIRALLALNNRAAAVGEYRQFQQLLRSELDIEPSREIEQLVSSA